MMARSKGLATPSRYAFTSSPQVAAPYAREILDLREGSGQRAALLSELRRRAVETGAAAAAMPSRIARVESTVSQLESGELRLRVRVLEGERAARRQGVLQLVTLHSVASMGLLSLVRQDPEVPGGWINDIDLCLQSVFEVWKAVEGDTSLCCGGDWCLGGPAALGGERHARSRCASQRRPAARDERLGQAQQHAAPGPCASSSARAVGAWAAAHSAAHVVCPWADPPPHCAALGLTAGHAACAGRPRGRRRAADDWRRRLCRWACRPAPARPAAARAAPATRLLKGALLAEAACPLLHALGARLLTRRYKAISICPSVISFDPTRLSSSHAGLVLYGMKRVQNLDKFEKGIRSGGAGFGSKAPE